MLREALDHPWAIAALAKLTVEAKEFTRQEALLTHIDALNEKVDYFMSCVENPKQRLGHHMATDLKTFIYSNVPLFSASNMLTRIQIALSVLAATRLRNIAKRTTQDPFNKEEFEREREINHFIAELFLQQLT